MFVVGGSLLRTGGYFKGGAVARTRDIADMPQLERELELEMEEDDELDGSAHKSTNYADRFHRLSLREFESESEVDGAVQEILNAMEQEFFFGKLGKGWNRFKKKGLGRLVKKGLAVAGGQIPALQALKGVTQLARGNLKGMVGSLAKAGLGTALPGGRVALNAMKNLGFGTESAENNRAAWESIVAVTRDAYEHLINNITENGDEPLEASRVATDAFRAALQKHRAAGGSPTGGPNPRRVKVRSA